MALPLIAFVIYKAVPLLLCLGSIELDRVISEPCYKGIIL